MKFLTALLVVIAVTCISADSAGRKVYVGNLSWNTTDETLKEAFSSFGEIVSATVLRDRDTGRSRGFGFVEFATEEAAQSAIDALNDSELDGRRIRVNLANVRP